MLIEPDVNALIRTLSIKRLVSLKVINQERLNSASKRNLTEKSAESFEVQIEKQLPLTRSKSILTPHKPLEIAFTPTSFEDFFSERNASKSSLDRSSSSSSSSIYVTMPHLTLPSSPTTAKIMLLRSEFSDSRIISVNDSTQSLAMSDNNVSSLSICRASNSDSQINQIKVGSYELKSSMKKKSNDKMLEISPAISDSSQIFPLSSPLGRNVVTASNESSTEFILQNFSERISTQTPPSQEEAISIQKVQESIVQKQVFLIESKIDNQYGNVLAPENYKINLPIFNSVQTPASFASPALLSTPQPHAEAVLHSYSPEYKSVLLNDVKMVHSSFEAEVCIDEEFTVSPRSELCINEEEYIISPRTEIFGYYGVEEQNFVFCGDGIDRRESSVARSTHKKNELDMTFSEIPVDVLSEDEHQGYIFCGSGVNRRDSSIERSNYDDNEIDESSIKSPALFENVEQSFVFHGHGLQRCDSSFVRSELLFSPILSNLVIQDVRDTSLEKCDASVEHLYTNFSGESSRMLSSAGLDSPNTVIRYFDRASKGSTDSICSRKLLTMDLESEGQVVRYEDEDRLIGDILSSSIVNSKKEDVENSGIISDIAPMVEGNKRQ